MISKERRNKLSLDYYYRNKKKMDLASKEWNKRNKEYSNEQKMKCYDNKCYGGNRQLALQRDNWQCQECGMTNEQHILLFGEGITVHHKDGKGRYSNEKNNDLDNLITKCIRCHAREDRLRVLKLK